jgi:hypothetical protein
MVLVCDNYDRFDYFWTKQWYWVDAIVRAFIPFSLIFIGNIFIVSRIIVANRLRKGQMQAAGGKGDKNKGGKVSV